jgi:hypothetical protein
MNWRLLNNLRVQRTLCIALLAVLGFSISCDRDCPTAPPPPPPPVDNGYDFYVLLKSAGPTGGDANVYVYNTKQMAYVDSIPLGYLTTHHYSDIEVAADEKFIVLSTSDFGPGNLAIFDLATREPVYVHPNLIADAEISPNGKYIAVQGNVPQWFLDASTFDTIAVDTGGGFGGKFDSTGNIFYSTRWRVDHSVIRRYDVSNQIALPEVTFYDTANPGSPVWRVQPTANPDRVFLYITYAPLYSRIVLYDLADSSINSSQIIASPNSELAITPDWKTVIFTDPFNLVNQGATSSNIYFVNATTGMIETMIPPLPLIDTSLPIITPRGVTFTPDGSFAIVSTGAELWWHGVLSATQRKYIAFLRPDTIWGATPRDVACRAQP